MALTTKVTPATAPAAAPAIATQPAPTKTAVTKPTSTTHREKPLARHGQLTKEQKRGLPPSKKQLATKTFDDRARTTADTAAKAADAAAALADAQASTTGK